MGMSRRVFLERFNWGEKSTLHVGRTIPRAETSDQP